MELLGLKFDNYTNGSGTDPHNEYNLCYMLFPYIPNSLRGEITKRNILCDVINSDGRRPFTTKEIVQMFGGLVDALTAMHNANLSHRDVKLENVLLQSIKYGDSIPASGGAYTPVLMDFGSAGPIATQLNTRQQVLTVIENAETHTTVSYRPPELFEGGIRQGPREVLQYGKIDVW